MPSTEVHVNKNAKFDPSSKIFEVIQELHRVNFLYCPLKNMFEYYLLCHVTFSQISKRWKLQSIEQQQKELEEKRKTKEAKEQIKKVTGNGI